ncbi:regulatory protein YycI of two-component signal transduction system YycFG [Solibacillus kalamii]|uniref:Transcriptional regulator n=1 Tax=Solibacillus kalamii TaxID=1748298 RepID=A0ABX3ZFA1_9BACL|nr:regulatory protein YycI of two-component signal transduction system YycFG [Solibacillus kalamii]OUZ38404.1 transcriptional regulator [Solibacillus kalamii]
MDWSRTKTIFIWVFLVLNIFLYTQYLESYKEGEKIEVLGETVEIEARLKEDNITYIALPNNKESAAYYSGQIKNFSPSEVPYFPNQSATIENNNKLVVTMDKPVKLQKSDTRDSYTDFVHNNVYEGDSYVLWNIDEEKKEATFFQKVNDVTLYYNVRGYVKLYWDDNNRIVSYEQTMLEEHKKLDKEQNLLTARQVLQILYGKNLLKPDSQITEMNLGYSTIVQLTQTQVFAPTWEVRVKLADDKEEIHFVNAVQGRIVEIQNDLSEIVEQTEDLE